MSINKAAAKSTPAPAASTAAQKPAQTTEARAAGGASGAASASVTPDQKNALQDRFQKDGFEGIVRGGCFPPPVLGRPGETLNFGDRRTAAGLQDTLSSPMNQLRVQLGKKDETVTQAPDGSTHGPDGQPLAQVGLNDGTTAYVDPNTNQYYLTDGKPNPFTGEVQCTGPYPLPEDAQFSNEHFSEADVKGVQRHAASGSVFDKLPIDPPFPWPPRGPIELPKLPIELPKLPLDPIMLTAADLKDGGQ